MLVLAKQARPLDKVHMLDIAVVRQAFTHLCIILRQYDDDEALAKVFERFRHDDGQAVHHLAAQGTILLDEEVPCLHERRELPTQIGRADATRPPEEMTAPHGV